jgi:hypothetical protein
MDLLKESMSLVFGQKGADTSIQKLINPMILQRMCVASYALNKGKTPEADIEGWKLVGSTPTVLCYSKYGVYVVAVRGTASAEDWQTNATIALNSLADTQRAQTMIRQVEKWKHEHPNETQWFATGHSLGGALCDVLLRLKLVREAFTFNPAVQPQDFNGKLPNRRVYSRGDPLYQLMGRFTVGAVLLPAKDFLTELRYRVVGENVYDYLNEHALSSFKDAPESLLVGNAKKQPKKPKQPKPRLPIPRGPNLQLIQDLFKKLEAQREPDREMDDLTREMDQIIPKDRTPAPPPPSPPSREGDGRRRRKMRGGVSAEDLNRWIEIIKQTTKWKDEPNTEVARQIRLIIDSFDVILPSATKQEKRIISRLKPELERAFESWQGSRYKDDELRDAMMNVMNDLANFYEQLQPDAPDLAEQRWKAEIQQRRDQKRAERLKLKSIKANKEVEEEADEEIERGSPIKSPKKQFLPTESPKGNGMSGGVSHDHLAEAVGYYEMKMPETYSVENLEQSMKVIQTVIKYIGRSATYDEKRRLRTYYDFINEELDAYKELNKKEKQQRFTLTVKRLNDFTNFLYSLKPPASEDPKKNLIADEIKEDAEVKRRTADYEARLQKKKEADEKLKEGKARPATFQYSREGLTANQKAAERAAYYRKNPAENPRKKVVEPVKVEVVKPKKEKTPKKVKEVKEEPKEEPKQPTLAERATLTRAKATLRKGIVRKLLRKLAEIRLWIKLYQTGPYYIETELKTKEREAYDVGRGIFTKNEWDEAYKQATDIDNRKWQNYLPQSAYDRIAKQVATIKEKLQKEADYEIENGPKPNRPKRLPKREGLKRMVTPNGYEWYVEDGKVFDLDGSRVGYTGMVVFKNIREI